MRVRNEGESTAWHHMYLIWEILELKEIIDFGFVNSLCMVANDDEEVSLEDSGVVLERYDMY